MLPRIKEVRPMPDYCLRIVFDDGRKVLYDVKDDMEQIESYRDLATIHGLFNQVQLDPSRTCVYWNDEIDLPSDTRHGVHQELRRHLLGGLCHFAGLYYFLTIRVQPARRNGRTCPGNGRLELYWRVGV